MTGSSAGIGEAIARTLAAEGAEVVVHGRHAAGVARVVEEITADGGIAHAALGDLSDDAETALLAVEADRLTGGIDVLINNAGMYANHTWAQASPDQCRALYQANVVAAAALCRALLPAMPARGWGRVIQLSSGEATSPYATMPDYAATKAAHVNLTVSLAKALDRTGVTVNTISSGIVVTPGVEEFFRASASERGWGELGGRSRRASSATFSTTPPEGLARRKTSLTSPRSWPARTPATSTAPTTASTAAAPLSSTKPMPITDIEGLKDHLQWAVEIEHGTNPPYVGALYSIKEGHNPEAREVIQSVFMEEMLHDARGEHPQRGRWRPSARHATAPAPHPTYLPHSSRAFEVPLMKLCPDAIEVFIAIEKPASHDGLPQDDSFATIGQFYEAIEQGLRRLCTELGEKALFCGDPARQITDAL